MENEEHTVKDNEVRAEQLEGASNPLKVTELSGYGDNERLFKPMHEQLDAIEQKPAGGKDGRGGFDEIEQQLSDLV